MSAMTAIKRSNKLSPCGNMMGRYDVRIAAEKMYSKRPQLFMQ